MKIVQFVNTLAATDGGPARNSFELNLAFNATPDINSNIYWLKGNLGETVIVADEGMGMILPEPGPRLISWRSKLPRTANWVQVLKDVAASDAVIIHGYYLFWAPIVTFTAKLLGTPVFCMPHGAVTLRQQKYSPLKKSIFDRLTAGIFIKLLTAFVVGSPVEQKELAFKFPNSNIYVASVGVLVPDKYKSGSRKQDKIKMLSISRIAPKKRIDLSIDCVYELTKRGIDSQLTIAGSGNKSLIEQLKIHANDLGIAEKIHFVGQVNTSRKTELMIDHDFFLLPSEDENFGIGFAEAVMSGLPAIVSENVAAATGYPGEAGKVVTNSECTGKGMAEAIVFLANEHKYPLAVEASREFAVATFGWSGAVDKWLTALKSVSDKNATI